MVGNSYAQLKQRFFDQVVKPVNTEVRQQCQQAGIGFYIRYTLKRDPHIFYRLYTRHIDKGEFASLFRRLFSDHYAELLYLCKSKQAEIYERYNSGKFYAIQVQYKNFKVIFFLVDDRINQKDYFTLMPLTVLPVKKQFEYDYSIEIG